MAAPHLTTLPDDVLYELFLWAIAFAEGRLWIKCAPLNLSQTCRSLRAFALSHCRFWAHLNFTMPFTSYWHKFPPREHSLIPLWLTRSGNVLLDLDVDVGGVWKPRVVAAIETISTLVTVQSRWKRVVLLDRIDRLSAGSYLLVTDLSQLRELSVSYIISNATKELQTSLLLNGMFKIAQTQTPIAPRLVHLHIYLERESTSPECLEAMLNHCPALECLTIGNSTEYVWPAREGQGIVGTSGTLNRLSRIRISEPECVDLLSFLNDGRAPALETMEVYMYYSKMIELTTTLLSPHIGPLIRRASLSFALDWRERSNADDDRDGVYRALPNVTHLHLFLNSWNTDYDLKAFSFGETGRRLLPELEYFKMEIDSSVRAGSLESMLASRMLHSDRFRAVIEIYRWNLSERAVFLSSKAIRPWVESGRLEVIVSYRKLSVDVLAKVANCSGIPTSSMLDAMIASTPKGVSSNTP